MSSFEISRATLARTLQQVVALITDLSDDGFVRGDAELGVSSIGAHLRHAGDAVDSLLRGAPNGFIDYDERRRDESVERDRRVALLRLRNLAARVALLDADSLPADVLVRHDAPAGATLEPARSSLERELMFVASHTVHHYALVAVLLRRERIVPPREFGVAVSTLRFQEGEEMCAR